MQTACARTDEVLAGAPFDNADVDASQRQFAGQHQPRRAAARYHHRMVGHTPPPISVGSGFSRKLCGTTRVLPQTRWCAVIWEWQGVITLLYFDVQLWSGELTDVV